MCESVCTGVGTEGEGGVKGVKERCLKAFNTVCEKCAKVWAAKHRYEARCVKVCELV